MELFEKLKKTPAWTAFLAALMAGALTHMFALVNVLHNFDDIANQPGGFGGGLSLGRWFLEITGQLALKTGLNYNLPFVNGVIFLLLLAVSAGFLVSVLRIEKKLSGALIGCLFIVFPTVSATLFYRYTVIFYGVGVLFSVLAVWVLRRYRFGLLLSAALLCLSMGLYQAYAPLTIGLFVLQLIRQVLEGEKDLRRLVLDGLYDCLALLLGLLLYFAGMKAAEAVWGAPLEAYQGIDTMGQLALADIPRLIGQAFGSFFNITFRDYSGISSRKLIQLTYCAMGAVSAVTVSYILIARVKKLSLILAACLLCILFPIAVNFIVLMCPDSWIYTLMVYSFVLVGCFVIVTAECLGAEGRFGKIMTRLAGLAAAFLIFCYGYYDNVNYSALYYANRQVENYVSSMVAQVRMTEGFTPEKQWVLIGEIKDPLLRSHWDEEANYGGNSFAHHLLINYSRNEWFENYVGYDLPLVSEEEVAQIAGTGEVRAMPCWPSQGSIQVIGDKVIIKFQEIV